MKRTKGSVKLIALVSESIFSNSNGNRPTYYYGSVDGRVFAIYSRQINPSNVKSNREFVIVSLVEDFSYDYENEQLLEKVKEDSKYTLKPVQDVDNMLENYHKALCVIYQSTEITTFLDAVKYLNEYLSQ